jgi:ABC-2 type transport system ATP-binding protein
MHDNSKVEIRPMNPSNQNVIQTQGLSKSFGEVQALKDLDLAVPKHSITGFLGPNGAGKTTTIRLLLGLNRPTAGRGAIFGHDIVANSVEIRKRVGYLAQQPHFYEDMTAREILRFTVHFFYKGPQAKIEARIDEMLELVDLEDKANRRIKAYSGGERQRLGIAQAQINNPDLLILDEPAAALDPMGRLAVLKIMERLREHATIFYSTHILDDVQRVSDRVVILNQGRLISQGPIEELLVGEEGSVYTVQTAGEINEAQDRLSRQPWVSSLRVDRQDGVVDWRVVVSDERAAQSQILRMILESPEVDVLDYGREKYELEKIFMQLVQGE